MKKFIGIAILLFALGTATYAQEKGEENEGSENITVPAVVKSALMKKYPKARQVAWEKEDGNYEANWGGKSGEDHSVQFTPTGSFIEMVQAISVSQLPANVISYVKQHDKGAKITEVGKVTDAQGKTSYEVEIHGKDVIFDANGNFVKAEK